MSSKFITTLQKNSPTILTGFAVAGLVSTVVLAVKATPKAYYLIEQANVRKRFEAEHYEDDLKLTPIETIKTTYKCYIPALVMGTLTVGCIISANSVNLKRNAALASVYALSEQALKEYQSKVVEMIGPTKARAVKDDIVKDKISRTPATEKEVIVTGKGEVMCYDVMSGRYFQSDIEEIKRCVNDFNHDLLTDMFMSINELYYRLGLSETKMGNLMGWHIDNGLLEVSFSSHLTPEGYPCLALDYSVEPRYIDVD